MKRFVVAEEKSTPGVWSVVDVEFKEEIARCLTKANANAVAQALELLMVVRETMGRG